MKIKFLSGLFVLFIVSCGDGEGPDDSSDLTLAEDSLITDSLIVDTLIQIEVDPARIEINTSDLLAKATETFSLPLLIDSNFIHDYALQGEDEAYNLTYNEAKYLGFSMPEAGLVNGGGWRINSFIEIDSLKSVDKYEDYLQQLDLGMTRYSIAHAIGTLQINSQSTLLIWNVDYSTYEACPFGYGVYVFGTIFTNGVGTNTCMLAEDSGGGDPPSWGDTYMQSEFIDSTITVQSIDRWGEYGDDGENDVLEKSERKEILGFDSYGFKVLEKAGEIQY